MCNFLIQNKEVIGIALQFLGLTLQSLIVIAAFGAVGSLLFHRKAVMLQRESIQASMFSEISGRISIILGDIPPKTAKKIERFNWYIRLLNEFESLIFLVKHKLLSREMEAYYRNFIIEYIKELPMEYPIIAKDFASLPKTTYCNLKKYFEETTGEKFPL